MSVRKKQIEPGTKPVIATTNLQNLGGWSSIIAGCSWIFGFVLFATVFNPLVGGELGAVETVDFINKNQITFYVWNLVIYVLFGVVQIILTLAIHQRLKDRSPALSQIAAALGLVWSTLVIGSGMVSNIGAATVIEMSSTAPEQAGTVWVAIDAVSRGIGGGNEIVGGLWVALLSLAAIRGGLPRKLSIVGLIFGVSGIVTLVPILTDLGAIFGLGMIVWYIWCGLVLVRNKDE